MLQLLFIETALELVPKKLTTHSSVRRNAKRRGKRPQETLLDRSLHHFAMQDSPIFAKRGRPDIIHFCLLEALGSPLNKMGYLKIMIHTVNNKLITVDPKVRIPRDYNRFNSLMEQLLLQGKIPPNSEQPLMSVRVIALEKIKKELAPSSTVALTSHGTYRRLEGICQEHTIKSNPLIFIGAYPRGPMSEETATIIDEAYCVFQESLESWIIVSRLLYECEKKLKIL
jgi:rRNA small subunit pseudouridine methyltransferase Nep1